MAQRTKRYMTTHGHAESPDEVRMKIKTTSLRGQSGIALNTGKSA